MLKILKTDLYKLFRSTPFYVIGIIITALSAISASSRSSLSISEYMLYLEGKHPKLEPLNIFDTFLQNQGSISTLAVIFIILFFCSEFSNGTMKNIASKGFRREYIYLSKFICGIVAITIYTVISAAVSLIIPYVKVGDKIPHFYDVPKNFLPCTLFIVAMTVAVMSIYVCIASIVRKSGVGVGTFFVIHTLTPVFMLIFGKSFQVFMKSDKVSLGDYLPSAIINSIPRYLNPPRNVPAPPSPVSSDESLQALIQSMEQSVIDFTKITPELTTRWICIIAVCLVVFTALGLYLFKKRDI